MKRFWRSLFMIVFIILLIIIGVINYIVDSTTASQIYSDVALIPKNKVGLLLGTAKYMDKGKRVINGYYEKRIDAAVALYMAGKVDYIIVSGDNSTVYYNEPILMRDDLIARGVPAARIYMDNAGFRTLDSILRCRDIFGQTSFTIISQPFHNQRAIYIANHKKITVVAFNAAEKDDFFMVAIREKLARVRMVFDLLFNTQAKYYGERVEIK